MSLASDIYEYGTGIQTYYGGLQECITVLKNDPGIVQAQQNLIAAPYITRATSVNTALKTFVSNMEASNSTLMAPTSGYYDYYNNEYDADSDAVKLIVTDNKSELLYNPVNHAFFI